MTRIVDTHPVCDIRAIRGKTCLDWFCCNYPSDTAPRQATKDFTQRAVEAEFLGEKGLQVQLEDMVRDESGHAEETKRI